MNTHGGQTVGESHGRNGRIAAWVAAALLLLAPLVAMQFTDEVVWTAGDFALAALLLLGSLSVYELAARTSGSMAYRAGVGLALAAGVLLLWINGAVGITDSAADVLIFFVPVVGLIGGFVARFRPAGMAWAMIGAAGALALIVAGALIAGIVPAFNGAAEVLGITGFLAALLVGSAVLFRRAALVDA